MASLTLLTDFEMSSAWQTLCFWALYPPEGCHANSHGYSTVTVGLLKTDYVTYT